MKKSKITTLVITGVVALGILVTMAVLCFYVGTGSPGDHIINLTILLTSMAVGWLLGTFISPDSPDEEARFSRYGTAIKAFASGYLISKSDRLITAILDPDSLVKELPMFRFLLSIGGVVVALMVTFILREYVLESSDPSTSVETQPSAPALDRGGAPPQQPQVQSPRPNPNQ